MRMRSIAICASVGLVALVATASPASAETYGYCWAEVSSSELILTPMFEFSGAGNQTNDYYPTIHEQWVTHLKSRGLASRAQRWNCYINPSEDAADREWTVEINKYAKLNDSEFRPRSFSPQIKRSLNRPAAQQEAESAAPPQDVAEGKEESSMAEDAAKLREKREAEWQAKLDKYASEKADWEAKVAAQKAEEERQKSTHAAALEEARKAKEAHEAKMAAHERKLAEAQRAREEWLAVKRRHDRCMAGDQQACEDMYAGKPASEEQMAANEEPKTSDDDARTCVSRPVVSASDTFKGQTAAVVFNGCKAAVDVRVCLLRSGGWNCGVRWGLQPQDRWTHTSFETQGEIFWDARMAGSNRPLASPGDE